MKIRTLLVDDEQLARMYLRELLTSFEEIEIVGEASNGTEALHSIAELRPDVVFLDIQMPGKDGLEVAVALPPPRPIIVFCTAFDEHAIRAFELHALDYLLKPTSRARLAQTVDQLREQIAERRTTSQELDSAQRLQTQMLPHVLPRMQTLSYAGACVPARRVGGDYYDFLSLGPRRLGLALADVCGKGVAAGLLMASLQGRLQTQAHAFVDDLTGLASALNRDIWRITDGTRFITFFYGVYDDAARTLSYINAGHNPPFLFHWSGGTLKKRRLDRGGTILGGFDKVTFQSETVALEAGDALVAFSDGITETRNPGGEEFGDSRLASLVESGSWTASELRDRIFAQADAFAQGAPADDDRTVIVARVL